MLIYFKPMNTLFSLHTSRCYIISSLLLVLLCFEAQAQLVRVIDNKGTIANVRNNQVTTALTAPTTPLEGDIWFDSTTAISKVWDGTTWKVIDTDVVTVANMAPTSPAPVEGDIWFNNTNPNTIFANVWNGAVWQPIQNSWLGNTTIHHTITTVLAITQALHNNTDIHIESTGDLSLTSTDVSDATNFYITNTTAADRTLSFTGFTAAYLRNGGPITDLSGGLTLKANTRYLAHITENSGNFYFNATEAGGGESGAISDEDSDTKIQVEEGTDDDTIRFDTDGTERAVISSTGNVGINISDPSDLFQVHSDDISSLSDTATTHEITTVLTQADANWHELISDVTGLYIKPDGLSFGALAVDPANNAHIQSFKEENSETRGIVVGDPTIVVDEVRTSYWYYLVDGGFIKAVLIDFRLNGIALEARRNSARFRSVVSTPDLVTIDRQNNAWFTGAGWTTPGSYQIDLIRVISKNILGTYPSNVIVATKTGKVGINVDVPSEALEVNGNTYLRGALLDRSGNTGTSGQVLSSTVTGTEWADASSGKFVDGTNPLNAVYTAGDVGIGTADPREKLEINNGNITLGTIAPGSGSDEGLNYFLFGHTAQNPLNNYGLKLQYDSVADSYGTMLFTGNLFSDAFVSIGRPQSGISSWTHDNMEEWARFVDGKLGIGTTSPSQVLDVNGGARIRTLGTSADTDKIVTANADGVLRTRDISSNKAYVQTYATAETFDNVTARVLNLFPQVTIQAGKQVKLEIYVPTRTDSDSWGGLYVNVNANVNGTWYNLGNVGFDGGVMHRDTASIHAFNHEMLLDFIGNLGLNSALPYTVQFELTAMSSNGITVVNGLRNTNRTINGLGSRGAVQTWVADQNFTHLIITEIDR
jgi:hypothetical protein